MLEKILLSDQNKKVLFLIMGFILMLDFLNIKKITIVLLMKFLIKMGPLAVLPCPSLNNKKSTFIYSTNEKTYILKNKINYK